jgi:hypothetical protein
MFNLIIDISSLKLSRLRNENVANNRKYKNKHLSQTSVQPRAANVNVTYPRNCDKQTASLTAGKIMLESGCPVDVPSRSNFMRGSGVARQKS